jgi:hypothetical protein
MEFRDETPHHVGLLNLDNIFGDVHSTPFNSNEA